MNEYLYLVAVIASLAVAVGISLYAIKRKELGQKATNLDAILPPNQLELDLDLSDRPIAIAERAPYKIEPPVHPADISTPTIMFPKKIARKPTKSAPKKPTKPAPKKPTKPAPKKPKSTK